MPRLGNQNVDSNNRLHEGIPITHKSIRKALKSCGIEHDYISLLKKIYRDQKATVQTDEESNMFEIRKGTKQGDPLSSVLFNTVLQNSLKEVTQRWQKKERNGNLPEWPRRRASVRNIHPKNSFKKCCANSREVLNKWVSGIIQERRKLSATKAACVRTRKKKCKSTILKLKS